MKNVICLLMLFLLQAVPSQACSVCFGGDPKSSTMQAVKWGIIVLLIVLVGVLSTFTVFFVTFQKRAKLAGS
jgi:hypothetical protein